MNTKNTFYEIAPRLSRAVAGLNTLQQWWQNADGSRSMRLLSRHVLLSAFLLGSDLMMGCSTVVVPLAPGDAAILGSGQGLVFGHMHVTVNEKSRTSEVVLPSDMQWLLSKNGEGKSITIDALPIDGHFAFTLPAGTYRLLSTNLDVTQGVWQAVLPATFTVQSGACTYVGNMDLDLQKDSFAGSMTRRVSNQLARDAEYLRKFLGNKSCPLLKTSLPPALDAESDLIDRVEGTELTSPP